MTFFSHGRRFFLPVFLLIFLSGCSIGYVTKQAIWQLRFINRRKSISSLIKSKKLSGEQIEKVKLIAQVKEYSEKELNFSHTDNYSSLVFVNRDHVADVVSAAYPLSLRSVTWWFPFVGRVPYLGYFDREDGQEKADELRKQGYDVLFRPTIAYSTLGWFTDPIFSPMLLLDDVSIISLILHELTHTTLFLRGQVELNESFAEYMGMRGAIEFCEKHFGQKSKEAVAAKRRMENTLYFARAITELSDQLNLLYKTNGEKKEILKAKGRVIKTFIEKHRWRLSQTLYRGVLSREFNNAIVLSYLRYHRYIPQFNELWKKDRSLRHLLDLMRQKKEKVVDLFD